MLSITIKNQSTKKIVVWGIGDYHKRQRRRYYINCSNENELLASFMNFWVKHYPDAITGWNTEFFDIPFLVNRVTKVLVEERAKSFFPGVISHHVLFTLMVDHNRFMIFKVLQTLTIYNCIRSLLTLDRNLIDLTILHQSNLVQRRTKTHTTLSVIGILKTINHLLTTTSLTLNLLTNWKTR